MAWRRLGARTRKEVLELARRGKLHPDPAVRTMASTWSESNRHNVGRTITATLVLAVVGVFWARMFGAPWIVTLVVAGCLMCGMLVNAVLLFGRLSRVRADPEAPVASEAETSLIGAVPGVRLGWVRRATAIVIGLLLGLPFMLVGLIGAVDGQGSRVVDFAVGVVGAALFLVGLRAIRNQRAVGRRPRDG